ncbi:MAG: hypothetical protein ACOH1V_03085 [Stenotrophomonas sp.]
MNPSAVDLLQLVAEDLRATDQATYQSIEQAIRQGSRLELQITFGAEPSIALGFRDDYERTRWVHSTPLQ